MEKPFEFIECRIHRCDEFKVTDGYQPTYAFFYLKEGSFRLKMDGKETVVQKNDSVIFYDDVNFFRTIITPVSFLYLQFRINPKCPFKIQVPLGIVNFRDQHRFLDSIEKYESLLESTDVRAIYYREHLLEDILLQAFAESEQFSEITNSSEQYNFLNCHDTVVLKAIEYIKNNLKNKLQISDICNHLGTNPSTLNFKFKKELSISVWNYITAQRMKLAKHYLTNTTYNIGDIASSCGYDNVYYFSNAFRKYYGTSPTAFRKLYR